MIKSLRKKSEVIWTGLTYLFQLIGSLILLKVLTMILSHREYGEYNLLVSISQLLLIVFFSPLNQAAGRYSKIYHTTISTFFYLKKNYFNINKSILLLAFVCSLVFFSFSIKQTAIIILLTAIASYFDIGKEFFNSIFHIDRQRKKLFTVVVIVSITRIIIPVALFIGFSLTLSGVLLGWIVSSVIGYFIFLYAFNSEYQTDNYELVDIGTKDNIKGFAKYFGVLSLFLWIQMWLDRWIINGFLGGEEVGMYAPFSQIGSAYFTGISGVLMMFYTPIFYEMVNKTKNNIGVIEVKKYIKKFIYKYIGISLIGLLFVFSMRKFIFTLLLGQEFRDEANVFIFLCVGWLLFNLGQLQATSIHVTGRIKNLLIPNVLSGIISIILNLILISNSGIQGAAYGFLGANVIRCLLLYYYENKSWHQFSKQFIE